MKTHNSIKQLVVLVAAGLVISITSCKKDKITQEIQQTTTNEQLSSSADNADAEDMSNDLDETAQEEVDNTTSGKVSGGGDGCRIVQKDSLGPELWQITISFKDSCVCKDGRVRKGKIIVLVKGRPWKPGSELKITPDGYYVDGFHVEGEKSVYFRGLDSEGNYVRDVKVLNGKITSPDGIVVTFQFEKHKVLVIGDPANFADDFLLISGAGSGTNRDGKMYEIKSLEPLKRIRDCHFIVAGILEVKAEGHDAFTINFGDGTCDDEAVVKMGDKTKVIKLRKPWKR